MHDAMSTWRYAIRNLVRTPVFTVVSALTLALGIGANAAIFSVIYGVLLKPLPFVDADRLVGVWHTAPGLGFESVNLSPATYFTYRDDARAFEDIGLWDNGQVSVTGLDEPEQVDAIRVTDGVFPLLRMQPALGRSFAAEDDRPDHPPTVILGHGYWRRAFGGDPGAVGRTVRVNGVAREIIGVMPAGVRFLRWDPAVYLPFQFDRAEIQVGDFSYQGVARLATGATIVQADREVERLIPAAVERFPGGLTLPMLEEARFGSDVHPLREDVVGDIGTVLWVLFGTVGLILLIACANVTNLFLVRAESRQRDVAIRSAMGASRGRLARQFLAESAVLGALGGIAGVLIAYASVRVLLATAADNLPRANEITVGGVVVLAFTLGISVLASLLFGAFPIVHYGRPDLVGTLKEGGRAGAGKDKHRLRNALAISQVALASVLLVASGLMVRSFREVQQVQPGFERPHDVLTVRVPVPSAEVEDPLEAVRVHQRILERVQAIPGVSAAGASSSITMEGWNSNDAVWVEDFPSEPDQIPPVRRFKWVAEGYFDAMQIPVRAGRQITWADIHAQAPVVMVTENFAREYWQDPAAAIGKRIRTGTPEQPWREIVGVVGDVRDDGVTEDPPAVVYWPMAITDFWDAEVYVMRSMAYAIRTRRPDPSAVLPAVRRAVWDVNPNLPLANVRTLDEILARSMARTSFTLVMLGLAAGVAIALGAVGIYGVIAYTVSQRTRELGVRVALGAQRGDVQGLVLRQGSAIAGIGVAIGLGGALVMTRLMSALLYGVSPGDPLTYAAAGLGAAGISLLAAYLPARRAATVDPLEALK